jgi:diaminopimelate epimerase
LICANVLQPISQTWQHGFPVVKTCLMIYCCAMKIDFHKMHGTLNDFVVFHDLGGEVRLSREQVIRICDRRGGIGADGVIVIRPSERANFFMDYINADGSYAEMCGNGIRVLGKYVYDNGLSEKTELPVETRAGTKILRIFPGLDGKAERIRVDMGRPIFEPDKIPSTVRSGQVPVIDYPVVSEGRSFHATLVSMGNPHCVIFVEEDPDPLPCHYGPAIENHVLFPARTNVEFIRVDNPGVLTMRVWERGSGETHSCGTGACASAVAAHLKGFSSALTKVRLLGGELEIEWNGNNNNVFMTGPAIFVYVGSITF